MIPAPVLRIVLGEFAKTLLGGQRVIPQKIISSRYRYSFGTIQDALQDLIKEKSSSSYKVHQVIKSIKMINLECEGRDREKMIRDDEQVWSFLRKSDF